MMKRNWFKIQNLLSVSLTVLLCIQMMGFLPSAPRFLVFVIGMCAIFYLFNKDTHVDKLSLLFLVLLPLTIVLASPDPVFKSYERLLSFVPLYVIGSPLFQSKKFREFRIVSVKTFIGVFMLLGIGSFFCYFLGINMMTMNRDDFVDGITYQTAGYFSGLTKQSMMLGPVGGVVALYGLYKYMRCKNKISLLVLIMGYFACIFSASRGALVATTFALLFLMYRMSANINLYLKRLFVVVLLIGVSSPIWIPGTKMLQEKHESRMEDSGLLDSRSQKFSYRLQEFASSPLYGVGFSAIDPTLGDKFSRRGIIEPGSSWLAILSMTGIVGAILFIAMFVRSVKRSLLHRKLAKNLFLSILILLSIHWIIEGYIFASGNTLCFFSWLMIGICYDKDIVKNNDITILV